MNSPSKSDSGQHRCTCTVEVSPDRVEAGGEMMLTVQVTGLRQNPNNPRALILDQHGAELAAVALKQADGGAFVSEVIVLPALDDVGERLYRAIIISAENDGSVREQASTEFSVAVNPHELDLNIWDVPPTIVTGERFGFKVGIRCSSACCMSGQSLRVVDSDAGEVADAICGADPWPGTDALYVAMVDALAPQTAGDHQWALRTAPCDLALPHTAGVATMRIKVVQRPDCQVRLEVFDADTQAPVEAARVVMHPYRAASDAAGVATLGVTKGRYDILVAGRKYLSLCIPIEVQADVVKRIELEAEPPLDPLDEA